jgi:hypothetical protein
MEPPIDSPCGKRGSEKHRKGPSRNVPLRRLAVLCLLFPVKAKPFGFASLPGLGTGGCAPFFASLPDVLGKKRVLFPS